MSAELTVVIMAYNEEVGLAPTVTTTLDFLTSKVEFEVLIVDDGSQDQTGPAADQLALSDPRVRVIHHQPNQGLGGVYRTGFAQARGEWLTFLPADGELPATNLGPFLDRRHDYDLLLGTIPERKVSWLAHLLSFVERALYRLLFGYFPPFQGILMVRTRLLRELPLHSGGRGWGIIMELVLRVVRGGYRWTNVPTRLRPRLGGHSKVRNLATMWANFKELLKLRSLL